MDWWLAFTSHIWEKTTNIWVMFDNIKSPDTRKNQLWYLICLCLTSSNSFVQQKPWRIGFPQHWRPEIPVLSQLKTPFMEWKPHRNSHLHLLFFFFDTIIIHIFLAKNTRNFHVSHGFSMVFPYSRGEAGSACALDQAKTCDKSSRWSSHWDTWRSRRLGDGENSSLSQRKHRFIVCR